MKKLLAILLMALCFVAFSNVDTQAKTNSSKARTTKVAKGKCSRCGGSGKMKCSRCGGKGYTKKTELADEGWWTQYYGCSRCGGYGHKSSEGYEGEYMQKGSGRMKCTACRGTGRR